MKLIRKVLLPSLIMIGALVHAQTKNPDIKGVKTNIIQEGKSNKDDLEEKSSKIESVDFSEYIIYNNKELNSTKLSNLELKDVYKHDSTLEKKALKKLKEFLKKNNYNEGVRINIINTIDSTYCSFIVSSLDFHTEATNLDSADASKVKGVKDQVEEEKKETQSWLDNVVDVLKTIFSFILKITIGLILIILTFIIVKRFKKARNKYLFLKEENSRLKSENSRLINDNKRLSKSNRSNSLKSQPKVGKTDEEINEIRNNKIEELSKTNSLDKKELSSVSSKKENRWITIGHSSIGKMHVDANPQIPCQDSHYHQVLNDNWQLAIVCDGAGSAKMSHFGSKFMAEGALPNNLNKLLGSRKWFKKGTLPSEDEWKSLITEVLNNSYNDLKSWVYSQGKEKGEVLNVRDFASTVLLTIYNDKGALVSNVGDGRGGYLNSKGEFKSLFIPYRGTESNETIFITSPIWDESEKYIQTHVIDEDLISVFLLSDGMEKSTFECSNITDDVFVDANIPFKKFFYPILSKLKSLSKTEEEQLPKMWKDLLESGNEQIKNESDDKTLVVSILK